MRKRLPITWDLQRGYFVDLPTYTMVPGTWLPLVPGKIFADGAWPNAVPRDVLAAVPTVVVEVPDNLPLDADGQIDAVMLREQYHGHHYFDTTDFVPPKLI